MLSLSTRHLKSKAVIGTPFYLLWQCLIISDKDSQTSKNSIQQARLLNHCAAVKCWKTMWVLSLPHLYHCTLVWVLPWHKPCLQNVWVIHWGGDISSGDSPYQCSSVSLGAPLWPSHCFLAQWSNGAGWPLIFGLFLWFPIADLRKNLVNPNQVGEIL